MHRLRVGIVGCGKQAEKHIAGLKRLPGIDLVVGDVRTEAAERLAAKESVEYVRHSDEIFTDGTIQATIICTPTKTHLPLIKRSILASKDVFCEKPLSDDIKEAIEVKEMLENEDRILMMGYIYRFVPIFEEGYRLVRKLCVNGESLIMGRAFTAFFRLGGRGSHQVWKHKKSTGGGAINEMLVHMIDLANWYFGPLRDVEVISNAILAKERKIFGETVEADAEDFIIIKCTGLSGVKVICQADLITPAFSQYAEIQCEHGSFMGSIQGDMPNYIFLKDARGGYQGGKTELKVGQRNLFDTQMLAFVEAVLRRQSPDRNTIDDSLQLMEIVELIRKQIGER